MDLRTHIRYLLRYFRVCFKKKKLTLFQLILDKTDRGYVVLLSIENCGARCILINDIKVELKNSSKHEHLNAEIVHGLSRIIFPGERIGAFLEITDVEEQEKEPNILKIVVRDSENTVYQL